MKNQIKKAYAIIPSAGSGTRFDAALPKQYFNINEELIIEKTINNVNRALKLFVFMFLFFLLDNIKILSFNFLKLIELVLSMSFIKIIFAQVFSEFFST